MSALLCPSCGELSEPCACERMRKSKLEAAKGGRAMRPTPMASDPTPEENRARRVAESMLRVATPSDRAAMPGVLLVADACLRALDRVATMERERDEARERAEEVCHMYDHSTGKGNPGVAWVPGSRTADSCHLPREVTVPAEALKEPTDD